MKLITKDSTSNAKTILFNYLDKLGYESIEDFQEKNDLVVDGLFGMKSFTKLYNISLNVKEVDFKGYYFTAQHDKKQIIWHHSAGWDNARGMFDWWKQDGVVHVGTSIGIVDDGTVYRGFDESYWAASIGARHVNNRQRDKEAVCVEICNWGNLTEKNGKFYSWASAEVHPDKVIEINYKGYKYFEKYTIKEIETLKVWTILMGIRFDIPLSYDYDRMFKLSDDAFAGVPGIYTHNSYRQDKTDVYPHPQLIEMAESLEEFMK